VDQLLQKWDTAMRRLEIAEAKYEKSGLSQRPSHKLGRCGWCGERVDTIDHLSQVVRDLNADIIDARQRALQVAFRCKPVTPLLPLRCPPCRLGLCCCLRAAALWAILQYWFWSSCHDEPR